MQRQNRTIASRFGSQEGKYTEAWKPFFGVVDDLQADGDHETVSLVLGRVLKTLVWSADSVAAASYSHDGGHRDAYADVTRFMEVWGEHASHVAGVESGMKIEGEKIANTIVRDVSKYHCKRCGKPGHLVSMCFVSKDKKPFRSGPARGKPDRDDREAYDYERRGSAPGFGGKRGVSRDRGPGPVRR